MAKSTTNTAPKPAAKKKVASLIGLIDSAERSQTRRVVVERLSTHPKYGKIMRSRTILHVHDEKNESAFGDLVEVNPCRPISKTKRWKLAKIIQKGVGMKFEGVAAPTDEAPAAAKPAAKAPAKGAPAKAAAKPAAKPAKK